MVSAPFDMAIRGKWVLRVWVPRRTEKTVINTAYSPNVMRHEAFRTFYRNEMASRIVTMQMYCMHPAIDH
jgi:hypothetical protein